MPSRIIREGLLDSQRYWNVTVEARQLFVHLMLLADDFGLVSLAPVFIRRRAFDEAPSQPKIDKLIEQLVDADLVRCYEDCGRYAFIPRFKQRLRQVTAKCPKPPAALYSDDDHAQNLFNCHPHLFEKMSARRRRRADNSRPEVEGKRREVEVEEEGEGEGETKTAAVAAPPDWRTWAKERGITPRPGESDLQFQVRVAEERRRYAKSC